MVGLMDVGIAQVEPQPDILLKIALHSLMLIWEQEMEIA